MAGVKNQVIENKEVMATEFPGGALAQKDVKNEDCSSEFIENKRAKKWSSEFIQNKAVTGCSRENAVCYWKI